jgi:hypothetical protein
MSNINCDYCNKECDFNDDKQVENYIPELRAIYCDECLQRYDKEQ